MIDLSLLDSTAIGQSLRSLAGRVEQHGDNDAGQRLRLLGEAVEKRLPPSIAITWSSIDISKFIDADGIAERYSQRTTTRTGCGLEIVEILRNVFIFAPIVITWSGISQATASYNAYISDALAKHDANLLAQPFLYLWQQGFGGRLPGLWTLSNIAFLDVIVLSLIIVLTLISHTLSNANRLQEEKNAHDLHAKLVHTVARATLALNAGQHQHQLIGGSSKNLDEAAIQVRDMATNMMDTLNKLGTDMMTRMDGVVDTLTKQFKQITHDLSSQVQQGGKYLATLGNTSTALQKLASDMNTAANKLIKANEDMTKSVSDLIDPAKDLAQLQQKLLQSVDKSVLLLDTNATTLEEIAKQHTSLINDLVDSLGVVRTTTQQMKDIFIKLEDFIEQQEKLVIEMKGERTEQERLANNMKQAMLTTQDTQKALKELSISFRQIAVDTQQTMRLYAAMPKNIGTDIAVAVQHIEKGGGDLSSAAMSIFSASQHFEKVVADQEELLNTLVSSGKI